MRYREALRIALAVPGDSFPAEPESMVSLGATLTRRGRPEEAIGTLREATRLYQDRLGDRHPLLPPFLRALATALVATGERAEAASIYQHALSIQEANLDADHTEIAKTLRLEEGRPAEAEALYRRSLSIMTVSLPAGHPYIGKALNGLGTVLNALGRHAEAESLVRPALLDLASRLPAGHDLIAGAQRTVGEALVGQRRGLDEAQPLLEQALASYRKGFGGEDARTAEAALALAECLRARGRTQQARAFARESLPVLARTLGEGHARTRLARRLSSAPDPS
jgi:tetratricopeptide (TPR) repeat protein